MAMQDDFVIARELIEILRQRAQWNQRRAIDVRRVILCGLAHVHEKDI